ncbi:MAG TPA: hypothetical protein DEP35_14765, partial [Deltaproteobacteria bacterium]|nr:hypothetical protein [Deltaproteobacteria bacterium]
GIGQTSPHPLPTFHPNRSATRDLLLNLPERWFAHASGCVTRRCRRNSRALESQSESFSTGSTAAAPLFVWKATDEEILESARCLCDRTL